MVARAIKNVRGVGKNVRGAGSLARRHVSRSRRNQLPCPKQSVLCASSVSTEPELRAPSTQPRRNRINAQPAEGCETAHTWTSALRNRLLWCVPTV
eukprot:6774069-Prymnesium_polylepis.2